MKAINAKLVRRRKTELLSALIKLMKSYPADWQYNEDATLISHKKNEKTYAERYGRARDPELYKLKGVEVRSYSCYAEIRIDNHKERIFYWPDILSLRATARWLRKTQNTHERLTEISGLKSNMNSFAGHHPTTFGRTV